MDFLLLLPKYPELSKKEIDSGIIPANALKISNYLRSIFLLSNGIRKDNNLIIFCPDQFEESVSLLIKIDGKKLRYLSPDERVTLLTLEKISVLITGKSNKKMYRKEIAKFNADKWAQSTPGIILKKIKKTEIGDSAQIIPSKYSTCLLLNRNAMSHSENKYENLSDLHKIAAEIQNPCLTVAFLEDCDFGISQTFLKVLYLDNERMGKTFFEWQIIAILQTLIDNALNKYMNEDKNNENSS